MRDTVIMHRGTKTQRRKKKPHQRSSLAAFLCAFVSLCLCVYARSACAQVDLSGEWGQKVHEDAPERGAGPEIGDYTGLPINDRARMQADSWDAAKWL